MPTVIPVKFAFVARDLWFDPAQTGAQEADHVICQTERGLEVGLATADAREVTPEELSSKVGRSPLCDVVRVATEDDLVRADELAQRGEAALPTFRRHVTSSGLEMKPVGVEYLFEGDKAVCYFAAEDRVDFRQLVRELSREFHVRIDMRQIGVREEAAIVGGYGHCGQELCCRRFNMSFDPVSIRMAKEQDLPLNSTKISGACGRLMCCLRYEFEAYRDFKGRAPKRNAVIDTPLGKGKIIEYNTPKEQICLRLENGKQIRVPLADMTASEAAHKKSEELGCACRPDTVTRGVLERLESPDVQMALAELDRKNGVVPAEAPDAADIFVEPKRKRRRSSNGVPSSIEKSPRGAGSPASEDAATHHRRRKRRPGEGGDPARPAASVPSDQAPSAAPTRRRRHHQTADGAAGEGREPRRDGTRRTRRPGDKGGQGQPHAQQPRDAQQPGGDADKSRRRRRRGGHGKGGNGGAAPEGDPGSSR